MEKRQEFSLGGPFFMFILSLIFTLKKIFFLIHCF